MSWGFRCSGPREPIRTNFCTGLQGWTKMFHAIFGVTRFIGLGAVRGSNFGLCLYNVHGLKQLALHYHAGMSKSSYQIRGDPSLLFCLSQNVVCCSRASKTQNNRVSAALTDFFH
jgi:hypothetical protein